MFRTLGGIVRISGGLFEYFSIIGIFLHVPRLGFLTVLWSQCSWRFYSKDVEYLQKAQVFKSWYPMQHCPEMGLLESDSFIRALTSSMN